MIDKEIKDFKYGVIDLIEEESIPPAASSSSDNFTTLGDRVELSGGNFNLGTTIDGDVSECTGIHVAYRRDGTQVLFRKRGRKLEVYDDEAETWDEAGTDVFPADAEDDEMSFVNYDSQAGAQCLLSSENSSIYKIMVANPLSVVDLLSVDYKGHIFMSQNRTFLVNRKGTNNIIDDTGVYISFIDEQNYTDITAEVIGTGDGTTTTFTGTLAFKAGGSKRTCFGLKTTTAGSEQFVDDYNGNLVGASGGTGTINYATGAFSITFSAPVGNAVSITVDYSWEDSTDGGLADFTFTTPTRIAGEGDVFAQDSGGGKAQRIVPFNTHEFCFHERKTWDLVLSSDDTDATNDPYRDNVGIPNWRAAASDGEGVYYIDVSDENNPVLRQMTISYGSTELVPKPLSTKKDLSQYAFDKCWLIVNDTQVIWSGRKKTSEKNDTIFIYDKTWKSVDVYSRFSSCGTLYNGSLVLGDSLSPNVYLAFDGYDDNGSQLQGRFETSLWDLDIRELKKTKQLWVSGDIQINQIIAVSASVDKGSYVLIGYIRGDGSYVDTQAVTIGSGTVGRFTIGGRPHDVITAFHYTRRLSVRMDKFAEIKLKFEVSIDEDGNEGLGYFSISNIRYHDIRIKQLKLPTKYRV